MSVGKPGRVISGRSHEGVAAPNPARAFNSGCPSPEDVSSIGLGWGEGLEENIQEALDRADAAGLLGPPVPSGRGGLDTGWSRPLWFLPYSVRISRKSVHFLSPGSLALTSTPPRPSQNTELSPCDATASLQLTAPHTVTHLSQCRRLGSACPLPRLCPRVHSPCQRWRSSLLSRLGEDARGG